MCYLHVIEDILLHWKTAPPHHCITLRVLHCTTAPLHHITTDHFLTIPLDHCTTSSPHHSFAASHYYYYHSITALQHYCLYHIIATLHHSINVATSPLLYLKALLLPQAIYQFFYIIHQKNNAIVALVRNMIWMLHFPDANLGRHPGNLQSEQKS